MATRETGQHYQDPKKALWCLKKLPLLADIPHDTLQQLADSVQLLDLRRRQVIYLPGDPGQAVYFLSAGRVKISKVTRDGKELTLDYRVAGDPFGELCLIEGGAREDMAEAMDTSLVIEVERGTFERLVQKEGLIGFRLVKILAQRRRAGRQDRKPDLQRRKLEAGRVAAAAGTRLWRRRQPRHAGLAEDHASRDGEPDWLDARDGVAHAQSV